MALIQVNWLVIDFDHGYYSDAMEFCDAHKDDPAYPGSVRQILTHMSQQSVHLFFTGKGDACRSYSFIRLDFLPTAVPFLRALFTPALTVGGQAVVAAILESLPDPFPTFE